MIIFIDNIRKYKFRINDIIKVGSRIYKIIGIEMLEHEESMGSVSAGSTSDYDFDTNLKPSDGYAYFIEFIGISGLCKFRFEFPRGQPHFTPHGILEYIDFDHANRLRPMYVPFIIFNPEYPSVKLYNPSDVANTPYMYFRGEKFEIESLTSIPPGERVIDLLDYPRKGNLGVA